MPVHQALPLSLSQPSLLQSGHYWREWLLEQAFPLWHQQGFDAELGVYHERLTLEGIPQPALPRRLMVQARQIATFCHAALDGLLPPEMTESASRRALATLERVVQLYHRRDGQAGWLFSVTAQGEMASNVRDLYGHAFILYAHALAGRLALKRGVESHAGLLLVRALESLKEVQEIFAAPHGGYYDAVPGQTGRRSQNPHMHLLEALLALYETWPEQLFLECARKLVALACAKFIDPENGFLREFFTQSWRPESPAGQNRVEPGHQFEWAWLLGVYARCDPLADKAFLKQLSDRLLRQGLQVGLSRNAEFAGQALTMDAVKENGTVLEDSTRLWPQTELLRLLLQRRLEGRLSAEEEGLLVQISETTRQRFLPVTLHGGWLDRFDATGRPLSNDMPASSLYHVYGAARLLAAL